MPRTLIISLDGTGKEFSQSNANTVLFHAMLEKDEERQLVYYQPGIGAFHGSSTHPVDKPTLKQKLNVLKSKPFDLAFATCLKEHLLGAYQFLVEHCKSPPYLLRLSTLTHTLHRRSRR